MAASPNIVEQERYTRSDLRELRLGGLPLLLAVFYVATVGFALLPLAPSLTDRYWVPVVSPLIALWGSSTSSSLLAVVEFVVAVRLVGRKGT